MRESKFSRPKYEDWAKMDESVRRDVLFLADVKSSKAAILEKVYSLIEDLFELPREKLLPLEIAQIERDAQERAENNAQVAQDLISGNIGAEIYELNVNVSPEDDVFDKFCEAYGQGLPPGISSILEGQDGTYLKTVIKPRLLAERRSRIKPFLDEKNDVLEIPKRPPEINEFREIQPQDESFEPKPEDVQAEVDDVCRLIQSILLKGVGQPLTIFEKRDIRNWVKEALRNNLYLKEKIKIAASDAEKKALRDWTMIPSDHALERFGDFYGFDFELYAKQDEQGQEKMLRELELTRQSFHSFPEPNP